MRTLQSLSKQDLQGKRVIVRTDFNVPIQDGEVIGDFRILKTLPTIEYLRDMGARIILMSHLGGENGKSLAPVASYLSRFVDIVFAPDITSAETRHVVSTLREGESILFENLRMDQGEKNNSIAYAEFLASFGDIYINDAFGASHREHASIVSLPTLLPSYAGLLLEEEVNALKDVLHPPHPFLFVLGGAKFETKLPLLKKFLQIADYMFIGGALAHNILQARGQSIGDSVVSSGAFDIEDLVKSDKVFVPTEVVVAVGDEVSVKKIGEIQAHEKIVDAGEGTLDEIKKLLDQSKFVLWNGPLGAYEAGFDEGTNTLARMIFEAKADSLVGGGDTLTAIHKMGVEEGFETISTGGGAMLEFLLNETLPGIDALNSTRITCLPQAGE